MSLLIRVSDSDAAEQYRNWSTSTPEQLIAAVDRLANLVTQYAEPGLLGDPDFFVQLRHQKTLWSQRYAMDVLEQQRIRERLSAAELKKLHIARKRSQQPNC